MFPSTSELFGILAWINRHFILSLNLCITLSPFWPLSLSFITLTLLSLVPCFSVSFFHESHCVHSLFNHHPHSAFSHKLSLSLSLSFITLTLHSFSLPFLKSHAALPPPPLPPFLSHHFHSAFSLSFYHHSYSDLSHYMSLSLFHLSLYFLLLHLFPSLSLSLSLSLYFIILTTLYFTTLLLSIVLTHSLSFFLIHPPHCTLSHPIFHSLFNHSNSPFSQYINLFLFPLMLRTICPGPLHLLHVMPLHWW